MNLLRLTLLTAGLMGLFGCDDEPPIDGGDLCCVNGHIADCAPPGDDHVNCGGDMCVPKGDTCPVGDAGDDDASDDAT